MDHIRIATNEKQVIQNIFRFQKEIEPALVDSLSQFRGWYAVKDGDRWIFGPSKFIGYHHMTAETYTEAKEDIMDGRKTEKELKKWFSPVESTPLEEELTEALSQFLASFGKTPNAKTRICVRHEVLLPPSTLVSGDTTDALAAAFFTLYQSLPAATQQQIRQRLNALS